MSTSISLDTGASSEAQHYQADNDFHALWLDPSMTYSCALWYDDDEDLVEAQRNKIEWHLDRLDVEHAGRLLDVGCGWGSLMRRATERNPDCRVTGLSLSAAQLYAIDRSGWPRIDTALKSWTDHEPEAPYDGIVSIGAFEHFAQFDQSPAEKLEAYRAFFLFCQRVTTPQGRLTLQTISYGTAGREQFKQFVAEGVTPKSDLPHLHEIVQAAYGLFEIVELRNDRAHYARTVRHWLANLREQKSRAIELVGEAAYLEYERYLGLMVKSFQSGAMNLSRIALRRLDPSGAGA